MCKAEAGHLPLRGGLLIARFRLKTLFESFMNWSFMNQNILQIVVIVAGLELLDLGCSGLESMPAEDFDKVN